MKVLLAGGKFIPEMHLRQTEFIFSASQSFAKSKEKVK